MPDQPHIPQSINAGRDANAIIGETNIFHGPTYIGGGPPPAAPAPSPTNVPTPSPTFVPRKPVTARIHAALADDAGHVSVLRQAVARAHGGYGKTVAAILYAHEYAPHYPGGRFFLSMERTDFAQALGNLAPLLGLTPAKNAADDAPAVRRLLENNPHGPTLLILDNVVDADQWAAILATGLVPRGRCSILITTRAERIPQATVVRVERLTHEEGREVYRRFCKLADVRGGTGRPLPSDATADAVTDLVGGLAVAVAAIAARMKLRPDISWDDYLATLRTLPVERLPDASPEVRAEIGTDGQALAEHRRTLHVIDDALDALPPPERRAIEYAAILPEDNAPAPWLVALLEADAARDDGPMKIALDQEPDLPGSSALRVVQHLDSLDALLEKGEGGKLLSLHRLWRARIIQRATCEDVDRMSLLLSITGYAAKRAAWLASDESRHHARWVNIQDRWEVVPLVHLVSQVGPLQFDHDDVLLIQTYVADMLKGLGRTSEAEALCQNALAMSRRLFEGDDHSVASCINNLSAVEWAQGKWVEAERHLQESLAMTERLCSGDHPERAKCLLNAGSLAADLGRVNEAEPVLREALAMYRRLVDGNNTILAISLDKLARVLQLLGRLDEAESLFRESLDMQKRLTCGDHPDVATSLHGLASVIEARGRPSEAEELFREALSITTRLFEGDHPDVATHMSGVAGVLESLGRSDKAEPLYRAVLAMRQRLFNGDHPEIAITLNNLGYVLQNLNRLAEAEPLYRQALAMHRRLHNGDHPETANTLNNLGYALQHLGRTNEAERFFRDALTMRKRLFKATIPA